MPKAPSQRGLSPKATGGVCSRGLTPSVCSRWSQPPSPRGRLTPSVKACRLCQLPLGGSLWRDRILCSSTGRCRRFEMASACALAIFSGKIIFISRLSRSAERSKRIFTGGVVTGNSICITAFCESTALRASACSPGGSCRVATEGLLIGGAGKNG